MDSQEATSKPEMTEKELLETTDFSEFPPKDDNPVREPKTVANNNLTISTKLSTDQLICKTPQQSLSVSAKSSIEKIKIVKTCNVDKNMFCLGLLQILFGFLMVVFGALAIVHNSTLSQFAGGVWGGGLAAATGIIGITAAARGCCPLKPTALKVTKTLFLALSLITLAMSQLVVVLTATGLARDINTNIENEELLEHSSTSYPVPENKITIVIPDNYLGILANIGLLIVSSIQCMCASVATYKCARAICPCFRKNEESYSGLRVPINNNSHAIVSSWLGKHNPPPQLYMVTSSTLGKGSKISGGLPVTPIFAIPPPMMQPQIMSYPLIPAPLGSIPSPLIPPHSRRQIMGHKRHIKHYKNRPISRDPTRRPRSATKPPKPQEKILTQEEVVQTYTGLDRTMAEDFINICEAKNASLCSNSSCSISGCQSACTSACNTSSSDATSREFLVEKL